MTVIDRMAQRIFGLTKLDAQEQGICIKCRKEVPNVLSPVDWREYMISALCPTCFDGLWMDDLSSVAQHDGRTESGL